MSMQSRLRVLKLAWVPLLWVACSSNTSVGEEGQVENVTTIGVALNHRLFALPSMAPAGSGCETYLLKVGGATSFSGGGGSASGTLFAVSQKNVDYTIVVDVTAKGEQLVEKIYDAGFFLSGKRDEFTASSSGQTMLLRFWASQDAEGHPQCAPQTDDGSQTALR